MGMEIGKHCQGKRIGGGIRDANEIKRTIRILSAGLIVLRRGPAFGRKDGYMDSRKTDIQLLKGKTAVIYGAAGAVGSGLHARAHGITRERFPSLMESSTHRKRSTGLSEFAYAAAFAASDLASAMTGAVLNLTGGAIVD
jgi:hypothetical protein